MKYRNLKVIEKIIAEKSKRQRAVSLIPYGIRIQHLRIVMEELLFLAFVKMKMGAGIQQD